MKHMFVTRKTHEQLAAKFVALKEHRDKISSEYTALKEEYEKLELQFNAMEKRYDAAALDHEFLRDCLAWIEEAPLYVRGVKTPDLIKRRKDIREMARKLGIVDGPEEEEQSA